MEKYIVSGCLAGICCRYDGSDKNSEIVNKLIEEGRAIPLCPEQMSGLPTPRDACECIEVEGKLRVVTETGQDFTEYFYKGAEMVLDFAKKYHIKKAILQKNSPSCGVKTYDGTFSHILSNHAGITAKILMDNGLEVISIEELEKGEKQI